MKYFIIGFVASLGSLIVMDNTLHEEGAKE